MVRLISLASTVVLAAFSARLTSAMALFSSTFRRAIARSFCIFSIKRARLSSNFNCDTRKKEIHRHQGVLPKGFDLKIRSEQTGDQRFKRDEVLHKPRLASLPK